MREVHLSGLPLFTLLTTKGDRYVQTADPERVQPGSLRQPQSDIQVSCVQPNGDNGNNRPHRSDGNGHGGNGSNQPRGNGNGNGNGNGRLTNKQYRYMLQLNEEQGRTKADLDQQCLSMFGAASEYLSKGDASTVIEQLLSK